MDAQGADASAADILSPQSQTLRILVVESKAATRQATVNLLRECSYQVREEFGADYRACLARVH